MFSKITHPKNNSTLMKLQTLEEQREDGSGGRICISWASIIDC
jgi:hypothetical protein